MNHTHESGRSNGNKLVSTLTVAGIGITALTSCAADQEPEAPIQTEVESTFVTEIPITPSPIVTETPAPLPIQTAESNPVNIPQPSTNESLTGSSEYALKAERYGVTTEEYEALVKSYEISSSDVSTPEEIAIKVAEKITLLYSGGLNKSDYEKFYTWEDPNGELNPGWNSWSGNIHSEAFQDALGTPLNFETLRENKRITASLWAASIRDGDPGYFMTVSYEPKFWTPYKTNEGKDSLGIVGTYTSTGNSMDNPSLQGNNKLPQDSSVEQTTIDVTLDGDSWHLNTIE